MHSESISRPQYIKHFVQYSFIVGPQKISRSHGIRWRRAVRSRHSFLFVKFRGFRGPIILWDRSRLRWALTVLRGTDYRRRPPPCIRDKLIEVCTPLKSPQYKRGATRWRCFSRGFVDTMHWTAWRLWISLDEQAARLAIKT